MTALDDIRARLPDFARDIKLNLGSLLADEGASELTVNQKWGAALAAAIAARNALLTRALDDIASASIDGKVVEGARTAAAVMAMTNIYYRGVHMIDNAELSARPAGLRMNGLAKHGIEQGDFELFGLAASAVKGCESCTGAHAEGALKHGVSTAAVQATLRIASVIHATAVVLDFPGAAVPLGGMLNLPATSQPQATESAN